MKRLSRLLLATGFVLATSGLVAGLAPALNEGSNPEALERGLDAIRVRDIRADIQFIASDELAGRDTPSAGLRIAARFVRARLDRLGFEPGGEDGSFFHRYVLAEQRIDEAATAVDITRAGERQGLVFGKDYAFSSRGVGELDLTAKVAYAGHGRAQELEDLSLEGAWALVVQDESEDWRERQDALRARGAVGILIVGDPAESEDPIGRRLAFSARRARGGGLRVEEKSVLYPSMYLSRAALWTLVGSEELPAIGTVLDATLRDRRARVTDVERHELENVAGLWRGDDPKLKDELLIVSAHYDHVGARDGKIYNGADDNGSGTTGLLALAQALAEYGPMRRSVLLLWVSGEEKGLLGSYAWTKAPGLPVELRPVLDLNIDMIGRNAPDSLLITPSHDHPSYNQLTKLAEEMAPKEGFGPLGSADQYWRRSDHVNFADNLGIPVAFLFSDVHEDYHKPTDTADKIDNDKIRRVTRTVLRMLDGLQADVLDL